LLSCVGYGQPDVLISWSFNGRTLVNSSLVTIYEDKFVQGAGIFNQSTLQLCSVGMSDAGAYTCTVSNGHIQTTSDVRLTVIIASGKISC